MMRSNMGCGPPFRLLYGHGTAASRRRELPQMEAAQLIRDKRCVYRCTVPDIYRSHREGAVKMIFSVLPENYCT